VKFYRKKGKKKSDRAKLIDRLDALTREILIKERGLQCEIHPNKNCTQVGVMHILSKGSHPRLRFYEPNLTLAGWFCSHFWTHHNSDDPRAKYCFQRLEEMYGKDYKEKLYVANRIAKQHTKGYLELLEIWCKQRLKEL